MTRHNTRGYRVYFEPMDVISESPEKIPRLRPEVSKIIPINENGFEVKE